MAELRAEVEAVPEEHFKQADADEWAGALADAYAVDCPTLHPDQMWREPPEDVRIDVSHDSGRYFTDRSLATSFAGYRLTVHVPFTGPAEVFQLTPNQFTLNPPQGEVRRAELLKRIEYARDANPDLDATMNGFVGTVQTWLSFASSDIDSFNRRLLQEAQAAIAQRRSRMEQRDAALAESAIPERRPGEEPKTRIVDAIIRRPSIRLPRESAARQAVELEPGLAEAVYEDILDKIRMHGLQMEQSPATYNRLDEEARRDTIVAMLNTHYEGRMASEAFNVSGHTDILLRFDGRNLFIGECKIWGGAQAFSAAIGQLFGYAGWRDTKLALLVFVRERGLTAIIDRARGALREHPQFVECPASRKWQGFGLG